MGAVDLDSVILLPWAQVPELSPGRKSRMGRMEGKGPLSKILIHVILPSSLFYLLIHQFLLKAVNL